MEKTAIVILAAGKGTRLNSKTVNKVVLPLGGKPMISYIVEKLVNMKLPDIFVVVGFAKKSVMDVLGNKVTYVIQKKRLGTASAVKVALDKIRSFNTVLVLQGDDSAFYTKELIINLLKAHKKKSPVMTLLTVIKENPFGLGRIKRDKGKVIAIVEEKNATDKEREIKEINAACYVFSVPFLMKYIPKIKLNPLKQEYYLTDLVEIAEKNGLPIETYTAPEKIFMGVNTHEELLKAQQKMKSI
jgi:bifunctional UDP-N-acetylglucosamine pyrophosphorylase / glucosamine-1-phosphate N-acetyltransferase